MIICLCQGINDRTLREIIASGARTMPEIQRQCAIGHGCGSCLSVVEHLLEENLGLSPSCGYAKSFCCDDKKGGEHHEQKCRQQRNHRATK